MIRTAPRRMSAIRQSPATAIAGFQHCSRPARWKRWSFSGRLQIPRGGLSPKAMAPLRPFRIGPCRTRLLRKRSAAHLSRSRQRQPQCWRNGILPCNRCDRRSITRMPLAPSFRMVRISSRRSSPRSRHSTWPPGSRLGCAAPTGGQPAPETQLRRDAGRYRSKFPPALSLDATCALGGEQMKYVLQGRIATMDDAFTVLQAGAIYVDGRNIIAVQDVGAPPPSGFAAAITAGPSGIIFPGLIELHNHLSYNALTMWSVPRKFADRGQWQDNADYKHRVSDPMNTIAKSMDPHLLASLVRYVETKCLLAGVTSSQGISLKSDHLKAYYGSVMRVVEDPAERRFPRASTHIPDIAAAEWTQFKKILDRASCLLLHLSEGLDDKARAAR